MQWVYSTEHQHYGINHAHSHYKCIVEYQFDLCAMTLVFCETQSEDTCFLRGDHRIRNITFNPVAQPVADAALNLNTYPGRQIIGVVGRTYRVESSTDTLPCRRTRRSGCPLQGRTECVGREAGVFNTFSGARTRK
jgi:hypothetical protein